MFDERKLRCNKRNDTSIKIIMTKFGILKKDKNDWNHNANKRNKEVNKKRTIRFTM